MCATSSNAKIATLTLNPALDQTARSDGFTAGAVNRVLSDQFDPGGKGVLVASFLAQFDHNVAVTGFLGIDNIEAFTTLFTSKTIEDHFVKLDGRTRVNVKIVDPVLDQVTDINFPGLAPDEDAIDAVMRSVKHLITSGVKTFVLAGSLPPGLHHGIYRDMVIMLKAHGARVYLDSSGEAMKLAIPAGPDAIKPNIEELRDITGKPLLNHREIVEAARQLDDGNIELVVVSMGPDGALFVTSERAILASPPKVTVKSTVGAGDAMVAGIVHCQQTGLTLEETARLSSAFSLGALSEIGSQLPPVATIHALAQDVQIEELAF